MVQQTIKTPVIWDAIAAWLLVLVTFAKYDPISSGYANVMEPLVKFTRDDEWMWQWRGQWRWWRRRYGNDDDVNEDDDEDDHDDDDVGDDDDDDDHNHDDWSGTT